MEKYLFEMRQFIEENTPDKFDDNLSEMKIKALKKIELWLKVATEQEIYRMFKYALDRAEYDAYAYYNIKLLEIDEYIKICNIINNMNETY